jgi:hypothetical protein
MASLPKNTHVAHSISQWCCLASQNPALPKPGCDGGTVHGSYMPRHKHFSAAPYSSGALQHAVSHYPTLSDIVTLCLCSCPRSYYWFQLALQFITLAGLAVLSFMGLLAASAFSWMAWLSVLALLTIQGSDTFLAIRSATVSPISGWCCSWCCLCAFTAAHLYCTPRHGVCSHREVQHSGVAIAGASG